MQNNQEHLQVTASVVDLLKFLLAYLHSFFWLLLTESQTAIVDLQAMWYPTVRRTLVCLSKLYNCIGVSAVKMAEVQHKIFCCVKGYHCCHWFSKRRLRRTVLLGIRPCVFCHVRVLLWRLMLLYTKLTDVSPGFYFFKVVNENTRTIYEVRRRSSVVTINFEHISHIILVFSLLTLNKWMPAWQDSAIRLTVFQQLWQTFGRKKLHWGGFLGFFCEFLCCRKDLWKYVI